MTEPPKGCELKSKVLTTMDAEMVWQAIELTLIFPFFSQLVFDLSIWRWTKWNRGVPLRRKLKAVKCWMWPNWDFLMPQLMLGLMGSITVCNKRTLPCNHFTRWVLSAWNEEGEIKGTLRNKFWSKQNIAEIVKELCENRSQHGILKQLMPGTGSPKCVHYETQARVQDVANLEYWWCMCRCWTVNKKERSCQKTNFAESVRYVWGVHVVAQDTFWRELVADGRWNGVGINCGGWGWWALRDTAQVWIARER